ncbi:hypothetical protein GpartN1_g3162.t1 [Galdieria partita]|uniref:Uncharacterized protein n=1 Tax=Galdieria partita TaxID=83374 RepID=A0A9C7PX11_9RHOD|nr:hypothetical protein GpartN1_g3162.t1 [Galdieria partita]
MGGMEPLAYVVTSSPFNINKKFYLSCSKLSLLSRVLQRKNDSTNQKPNSTQVVLAIQPYDKMKDGVIELFRQTPSAKPNSVIQLPHLFVGQLKPLKADSQVNLGMLGIFASCVIVFSSILKKVLNKDCSKSASLSESNSAVFRNEQDQQPFHPLECTFRALESLKNAINDDTEHASDLFLKFLQESPIQKLPHNIQTADTQSLERVVTEILKEVDKKMRYYHSLFTILEKFSQQAVNELETHLKEASKHDSLLREIAQNITDFSYNEMKTAPRVVSELYEQLRNNNTATPISQKCEKVSLDITRMKRTLQFTMTKLQELRAAASNSNIAEENLKHASGFYKETEPQDWLRFLETKTDTSKLSSLQRELESIPKPQQWTFLSSRLERAHQNFSVDEDPTEHDSTKQLIQEKDEEIALLRQRLQDIEEGKLKTRKVRTKASKSFPDAEKVVGSGTTSSKRIRSKRKVVVSESEDN